MLSSGCCALSLPCGKFAERQLSHIQVSMGHWMTKRHAMTRNRILFILCILVLTVPSLARAETPQPQMAATLEASYPMDDPVLPPLPDGYEVITKDSGFENDDGVAEWKQYSMYPLDPTVDQVECDTFAAEGQCYIWHCAYDYCLGETRQLLDLRGWRDIHVEFFYHIETQEEDIPQREWRDETDVIFRDTRQLIAGYVDSWGNQDHTPEWQYALYGIEFIEEYGKVWIIIQSETDDWAWTGFYYDAFRVYGKPPYPVNLPLLVR